MSYIIKNTAGLINTRLTDVGRRCLSQGNFDIAYSDNKWLTNTTAYTFIDKKDVEFTSNNPFEPFNNEPLFNQHQSLKAKINLKYNFSNKYVTYPTGRFYLPSKWPELNFSYTKAISDVFGSDADFDQISLRISKPNIKLGFYGKFNFSTEIIFVSFFITIVYTPFFTHKHHQSSENRTLEPFPKLTGNIWKIPSKFKNRPLKTLSRNLKSGPENP